MSEEIAAYRRRESAWQSPGACAHLVFAPPDDTTKVPKGIQGTVTPHVDANAGRHRGEGEVDALGAGQGDLRARRSGRRRPRISSTPSGADRQRMKAKFRATSTAGVAEGTWGREIEDRVRYSR